MAYRTPDYTQLLEAMAWAARELVDSEALSDRASAAATEAQRKANQAKLAFENACEKYRKARWP